MAERQTRSAAANGRPIPSTTARQKPAPMDVDSPPPGGANANVPVGATDEGEEEEEEPDFATPALVAAPPDSDDEGEDAEDDEDEEEGAQSPEFMLHRVLRTADGEESWETCAGTEKQRKPDSRVHRYDRAVGFRLDTDTEAMMERDEQARNVFLQKRKDVRKSKGHPTRVKKFAKFERYVLKEKPAEPYADWLRTLERSAALAVGGEPEASIPFEQPPLALLICYADFWYAAALPHTQVSRTHCAAVLSVCGADRRAVAIQPMARSPSRVVPSRR
jgi:hypothetical protein